MLSSACPQINDAQPFLSLNTLLFPPPFVLSGIQAAISAEKYVLVERKHKGAALDTTESDEKARRR